MSDLRRALGTLEYFTFGFGSMVGVGWLVVMDDWLGRGGPGGAVLGFLAGGLLLLPIARTYGRLVQRIPDAGAEVAYAERVFPRGVSFAAGWVMVLAYAIVCPWEAVAIGNLLARVVPGLDAVPLYVVAGRTIYAPRLAAGLVLTALIALVNWRGIRASGVVQDVTTLSLLAAFAVFSVLGFARGDVATARPLFAAPGTGGALLSTLLVLQIVPYFMTGFESVAKASEEARPELDRRRFALAIDLAVIAGALFYAIVIAAVALVFPWRELVAGHLGSDIAFARAFGSRGVARLMLCAALLSLFKVFNGNFVAATRLVFALGRRGLVPRVLGAVHPRHGTPGAAVLLVASLTAAAACLGDAVLVPISEVGSLAGAVGWLAACAAYVAGRRGEGAGAVRVAVAGAVVSAAIILMKVVPGVPGSFTGPEWVAFAGWCGLGVVLWLGRGKERISPA